MSVEQGWPILKRTMCRVGLHVWVKAGTAGTALGPADRCDCGAVAWDER